MTHAIIEIGNISKRYKLGQFNAQTVREELDRFFQRLFHRRGDSTVPSEPIGKSVFWALKDVSFTVQPGEVVGLIGANGAGKSTLLKILSRVTEPTSGQIALRGRVASLLEVGTGFHPELTGRENIYLNGAILGMTKADVKTKFDEIVSFAEVEQFLETPVKRYSSGMYVRLAFAVAAHLEPEILVVDEVLAVGDVAFQRKCLGKMQEASKQSGRTVILVSHNMAAVQNLCTRGVLLSNGSISYIGDIGQCVQAYLNKVRQTVATPLSDRKDRIGNGVARILDVSTVPATLESGRNCRFAVEIDSTITTEVQIGIAINTTMSQPLLLLYSGHTATPLRLFQGRQKLQCVLGTLPLAPGTYHVNVCLQRGDEIIDWIREAATVEVQESDFFGSGKLPVMGQVPFLVRHSWNTCA